MENEQAINIAVGCVMASALENDDKEQVIKTLRELETEN